MSDCPVCQGSGDILAGDVYRHYPSDVCEVLWELADYQPCGCVAGDTVPVVIVA